MSTIQKLAAIASALAIAVVIAGCGAGKSHCMAIDVSGSTKYASPEYQALFQESVDEIASTGGAIRAAVVAGNPLVQSSVQEQSFKGLTGSENTADRAAAVDEFTDGVEDRIPGVSSIKPRSKHGSGVLAAISLLAEGGSCETMTVLSDGLESADAIFPRDLRTAGGSAAVIASLKRRELIPELAGADLRFPYGGYVPQSRHLTSDDVLLLKQFWTEYAAASGSVGFSWGS